MLSTPSRAAYTLAGRMKIVLPNDRVGMVMLNAVACTHTSAVLRDAIVAGSVPIIEVHSTSVCVREELRNRSLIVRVWRGLIAGLRAFSCLLALWGAVNINGRYESLSCA
jgi:3-dehydroquinate dehydratase